MSGQVDVVAVVDKLLAAISAGDADAVGAIYADDVTIWHSFDNKVQARAENLALLGTVHAGLDSWRYEITARLVNGLTLAQEHILHVTPKGRRSIAIPSAIFVTLKDNGQVAGIREYLDSTMSGGNSRT